MQINDPDGVAVKITSDRRISAVSVMQTDINALAGLGMAWTLPFTQTGAANTNDNVVFHVSNDSDRAFDVMRLIVSSAEPGLWSIAYGNTYTSGGTVVALRQLNTSSGKSQDITANYGTAIVVGGTATDTFYTRVAADTPFDLLNYGPIVVAQSGTMTIRFKADTGGNVMGVTSIIHGQNPWD